MLAAACSSVPHSTARTPLKPAFLRILTTLGQSITPSPQAQPLGTPVTFPRASTVTPPMSLAWTWTTRLAIAAMNL